MKIFPAIDIEDGHCGRLKQGKIQDLTVYGDDPVKMALKWESLGAKYLHVVDLDGAFKGNGVNTEVIHRICQAVKIPVEVGGGIRTEQAIKQHIENGVWRVIIGSKAVASPYFAIQAAKKYGADHIAVSVDAHGDTVATNGWVDGSRQKILPFVKTLLENGVNTIVYTDISRDGMLTGPNFEMMGKLQALPGIHLIASGGVSCADDLRKLSDMGLYGAITGKALYEEKVSMEEIVEIQEK